MEKSSNPTTVTNSKKKTGIIIALALLCGVLLCCLVLMAGILVYRFTRSSPTPIPASPTIAPTAASFFDIQAEPINGSVKLQRGFTPDPFTVDIRAGGTEDTTVLKLDCGFTTSAPMFTFSLSGGASETLLRIYYTASDQTDTTLIVYTPDSDWICMDNNDLNGSADPVIDIDFAPSGQYSIWVGTKQRDSYVTGKLFITGSRENTP